MSRAAFMVAGYFGLFGDSEFTRMSWFAVGFVGIFACLILANAVAGFATVTATLGDVAGAVIDVFWPEPARDASGRTAPPSRRRRLVWWAWLIVVVPSLAGALALPAGPEATGQALLATLAFLLLLGGWLLRLKQVWGGWELLGWLTTIAVLIGVCVAMASVLGDHSGWLVIPALPLMLLVLGGFFGLFSGLSGGDGGAGVWSGDFGGGGGVTAVAAAELSRAPGKEIRWFRRRGRIAEVTRYMAGSRRTDDFRGRILASR